MNLDEFEQRLARTPLPAPPPDLRRDVLEALRRECQAARPGEAQLGGALWRVWIQRGFERLASPWGVLGAACALVLSLMSAGSWLDAGRHAGTSVAAVSQPKPTRLEVVIAMRSQRSEIAVLMGIETEEGVMDPSEPAPIPGDRPRGATRPRTEWRPVRREAMGMMHCGVV